MLAIKKHDTVVVWNDKKQYHGIVLDFGCHTVNNIVVNYEWIRILVDVKKRKLNNYDNGYPYVEFYESGFLDTITEYDGKFKIKHTHLSLIEKNVIDSYYKGFDIFVDEIAGIFA